MFRFVIIMGNFIALCVLLFHAFDDPPSRLSEISIVIGVIFLLFSNVILLIYHDKYTAFESWPLIIIKRRTLEEKARIKRIQANDGKI